MSQRDEPFKRVIADFLASMGLRVTDIPRSAEKTPDLSVEETTPDATLIEIKQKGHDQEELDEYMREMEACGFASRSRPTGYRNRIDGLIGSGVQQLIAKDPNRSQFRVMWIHCEGYDVHLNELQLRATIYGTQKLFSTGHRNVITCYYFWNSSFFRYRRDLDAVIMSFGEEAQLMLNDHSPRFEAIKTSKLAIAFGNGVFFPQQYQLSDDVIVCDHGNARESETDTLAYLRSKYGLDHLQTINMGMHEAAASVRDAE